MEEVAKEATIGEEEVSREEVDGKRRSRVSELVDAMLTDMFAKGLESTRYCAMQSHSVLMARKTIAHARLRALETMLDAKEALKQKEAFYLLGTDPETQQPYINGRNEAVREAQMVVMTKNERDALRKAEIVLAKAQAAEDLVADDVDLRLAVLYVHAARGFPEIKVAEPKAQGADASETS